MKTTGLLLLLTLAIGQAQVDHRIVDHRYLWQIRDPSGFVIVEDRETMENGVLTVEKWERGNGVLTQALARSVSTRIADHEWKDTVHEYVEWKVSSTKPITNQVLLTKRGLSWEGSAGAGVWQTEDGYRYLQVSASAFDVFWTKAPTICLSNGVDQGVACVSAFRHQEWPWFRTHVVTLGTCTIGSLEPESGMMDNRSAHVKLPIDPKALWKFIGRGECYYRVGDKPCWFWEGLHIKPAPTVTVTTNRVWNPVDSPTVTASVSMPAPDGLSVVVWRSTDLENWTGIGTAFSQDGWVRLTDTNAPSDRAFYKWEEAK